MSVAASIYIAAMCTSATGDMSLASLNTKPKPRFLAPQLGARAPTLPCILLFSSSGDVEQPGLVLPCKRAHSRTGLAGALWASVVFPLRLH